MALAPRKRNNNGNWLKTHKNYCLIAAYSTAELLLFKNLHSERSSISI